MGDGAGAEACAGFGAGFQFGGPAQPDDAADADDIMSPRLLVRPAATLRRCTVMAESVAQADAENFAPAVVPKRGAEEAILRSVLEKNYLFKHLDDRELTVAVQAMFQVRGGAGEGLTAAGGGGGTPHWAANCSAPTPVK